MSNLATADRLRQATSQLPVSWYCDPALFALEQRRLFQHGPGYVGHALMVPNPGDYYALAWRDNAQVLVRNAGGVELLSNVCRHRQAVMLKGRGNAENIVCPVHRWTYDLKGSLLGAPHFEEQPCVKLE
ncbi:MAG: Rieske (2Fe-2S) protein, partial [Betaproteobacteria bacterium]